MNTKRKILNVVTVMREGGMEKLICSIYKGLSKTGEFDLYVCTMVDPGNNFLMDEFRKIPSGVYILGIKNHSLKLKDYFILFFRIFTLARYISKNRFEVVHSHDFFAAFITRIAVLLSVICWWHKPEKNIVTLHNLFFWLKKPHFIINRFLSVFTDKIVCVSRSVMESSLKNDRIRRDKYLVIYNAIDENEYLPNHEMNRKYRSILGFDMSDIIIGNAATLSFRKGHKYLLEAFGMLHMNFPNAVLAIFGGLRSYETVVQNEIQRIIKEMKIENKVRFFEPRDDIKYIYNIFDVYVMSSVTEGLSLAAIEAMLMERVCIFSSIGPFQELVENGRNGLIFESGNSDDLCKKISSVLENYKEYIPLGVNARNSILSLFNYRNMISAYRNIYIN